MSDERPDATSDEHVGESSGDVAGDVASEAAGEAATVGERDAGADETTPGIVQGVWQHLVAAGTWISDTFRGHSGARELKKRNE